MGKVDLLSSHSDNERDNGPLAYYHYSLYVLLIALLLTRRSINACKIPLRSAPSGMVIFSSARN
jgi:hypothetical protein